MNPAPLTGSKLRWLRTQLLARSTAEDLALLAQYRQQYTPALIAALQALVEAFPGSELALSARIKNSATIIDKLRREHTMNLARMQDIAGIRLVISLGGRARQREIFQEVLASGIFDSPEVIDRVVSPKSGYRAVHIYGMHDGRRMELQIRTQLQHDWAQFFERLADLYGRQIRYGQAPSLGQGPVIDGVSMTREDVIETAQQLAKSIDEAEQVGSQEREEDALTELRGFRQVLVPGDGDPTLSAPPPRPSKGSVLYLVLYDRLASSTLRWLAGDADKLQPEWTALEEQHGGNDTMEIVLLASHSLETLRKTHARYFTSLPGV